ncbi:MAG TPA: XRE family transcriptional regulator [Gammaproteobacteria bacterium]|nr:XRE family transcriptional regulator [Gammaproteobacteria bacterium]
MQKAITSPKYASLVIWLKQAREDQGISMRELASRLDEPHSFVQKVEIMERRLDVFEYTLYCEALGVDPMQGMKILLP